ncbi:PadR family transcriptional regulator [Roseinatronobacter alkalisoli]|uniref:PadR family transcriptional regulator n=1 Tax=Roseinatronobacter alkalisoli TaxID=3028235 RepID=A0ABT5TED8_9RHOB|nr:PadR family transcriptional regulator [Roseinatronobacter sp. HJB301]MDD7973481.1 PadR family transcriptional regulator [Roseinatronobacter sp. HJB301]
MKRESSPNYLNGVPELLVLRLLKEREMYGYELVQAIRDATGEAIVLGEGVIYPMLHLLEREGALQSRRQTVAGRSRIYYTLTPAGEKRLTQAATAWTRIHDAVTSVLGVSARG